MYFTQGQGNSYQEWNRTEKCVRSWISVTQDICIWYHKALASLWESSHCGKVDFFHFKCLAGEWPADAYNFFLILWEEGQQRTENWLRLWFRLYEKYDLKPTILTTLSSLPSGLVKPQNIQYCIELDKKNKSASSMHHEVTSRHS
jgi:hypothetical protein